MNNTNQLISGDNKGSASILMEQAINGEDALTGKVSKFVYVIIVCIIVGCSFQLHDFKHSYKLNGTYLSFSSAQWGGEWEMTIIFFINTLIIFRDRS